MNILCVLQRHDLKEHRYAVGDTLTDVCMVLGGLFTLERILIRLENELRYLPIALHS